MFVNAIRVMSLKRWTISIKMVHIKMVQPVTVGIVKLVTAKLEWQPRSQKSLLNKGDDVDEAYKLQSQ